MSHHHVFGVIYTASRLKFEKGSGNWESFQSLTSRFFSFFFKLISVQRSGCVDINVGDRLTQSGANTPKKALPF